MTNLETESDLEAGVAAGVVGGVGVLHLQEVVGVLHQKEEGHHAWVLMVLALQESFA